MSDTIRVLHTNHTSVVSGGERCLLDLVASLPARVASHVACPEGDLAQRAQARGVPVLAIRGMGASLRLNASTFGALAALVAEGRRLARLVKQWDIDVIHANSTRAALAWSLGGLSSPGPPQVVTLHDCLPARAASQAVKRLVRRRSAGLIANSRYTATRFAQDTQIPITVAYNPIDFERFRPIEGSRANWRRHAGLPTDVPLIGIVAQITPWKAQREAIEGLASLRRTVNDAHLLIAGAPLFDAASSRYDNKGYERGLKALVSELGLVDNVSFLGQREDVPSILRALDVLVMPSWEEPFGRIAVEAMATGTFVIATSVGGPQEYIEDGVTGLLVEPRDPEALAAALRKALGSDSYRSRVAASAHASVWPRFGSERFASIVVREYDRVLGNL